MYVCVNVYIHTYMINVVFYSLHSDFDLGITYFV